MLKSVITAFFVLSSVAAASALGDTINVYRAPHGQVVTIQGQPGGIANEIFGIMRKAGVRIHRSPELDEIDGTDLSSFSRGLQGQDFSAALVVNGASRLQIGPENPATKETDLILSGQAAQELYDDMVEANLPQRLAVDGNMAIGKHLSCSVFYIGGARFSCSLQVK